MVKEYCYNFSYMTDVFGEVDITKLKYVIYARKSTTDKERQVRSIPDQISDCKHLAAQLNLNVIEKPLIETKSAKIPGIRPVFRQMISDIKAGKYNSILSWNPDRLARNMLEGGEIINLVDEDIIKDLKFKTHFFTKDANGKMLLGMAFVLSKQYSDDLSQKVTRGVRSRLSEGKTPTPKYGYINEDGIYKPDNENNNFALICEAWQKRKEGESIENISEWLNKKGFYRMIKKDGRKIRMTQQKLSEIFKDSFYYGILVQAKQQVDLRELYDFQPALYEEDYNVVQSLTYRRIKPNKQYKTVFYPLRLMVFCDHCNNSMVVAPSTGGSGIRYLNFRCDNKKCKQENGRVNKKTGKPKRSLRANVVFNFITNFLEKGLNLTEEEYEEYYDSMVVISDKKREKISIEINSLQGALKAVKLEAKERSLKIIDYKPDSPVWKINNQRIIDLEHEKEQFTKDITKLKTKLTDPEQDRLTLEEFLNLSKNAATIIKSANAQIKDIICRKIFLNFRVDTEKVVSYQLREPFATLLKRHQFLSSRDGET